MTSAVSVLIVTWNCRDLIDTCLTYLFASQLNRSLDVTIVDNASADGTAEWVRSHHSRVRLVDAGANLGFGRANNLAAEHAQGDYLLLLNPDAFLADSTALARLCSVLDGDSAVVAVAPMLTNPDGSHQVGDAGFAPTIGNVLRHQWLLSRIIPGVRGFYVNRPGLLRRPHVRVDWLAATCLLVRRSAFERVGGFDPSFFMYGEDVDLGLRLRKRGGALLLMPPVRVVHLQGATQRRNAGAIHVSFGWINALFALHAGNTAAAKVKRTILAATLTTGFLVRALVQQTRGSTGAAKAEAMQRYARHSWGARR